MSLGFLTESALLPSEAKPIKVDSRSQIPLKAIVAEELSKREAGGGEGARKARGKKRVIEEKRRDPFQGKNKGVDERERRDAEITVQDSEAQRVKNIPVNLQRKAAEYDRIMRGEVDYDSGDDDNLVDFSKKRRIAVDDDDTIAEVGPTHIAPQQVGAPRRGETVLGENDVEITDEFGRARVVSRTSEAYAQWKALQRLRRLQVPSGHRTVVENLSSADCAGMAPNGGGPWSWSRGDERPDAQLWDARERRKLQSSSAAASQDEDPITKILSDGAIKTQWERTLQSTAREYLDEVVREEQAKGGGAGASKDVVKQKLREREERRAKLMQKLGKGAGAAVSS